MTENFQVTKKENYSSFRWVIKNFDSIISYQTKEITLEGLNGHKTVCELLFRPKGPENLFDNCLMIMLRVKSSDFQHVDINYRLAILNCNGEEWKYQGIYLFFIDDCNFNLN